MTPGLLSLYEIFTINVNMLVFSGVDVGCSGGGDGDNSCNGWWL